MPSILLQFVEVIGQVPISRANQNSDTQIDGKCARQDLDRIHSPIRTSLAVKSKQIVHLNASAMKIPLWLLLFASATALLTLYGASLNLALVEFATPDQNLAA